MSQVVEYFLNYIVSCIDTLSFYICGFCDNILASFGVTFNFTGQEKFHTAVGLGLDIIPEYYLSTLNSWFAYDEFQLKLLKVFLVILFSNLLFIFISWKVYGSRISDKFMRPASSKSIEDLKRSVALLKLPKEHSPRV